jgi:hypothetical protein
MPLTATVVATSRYDDVAPGQDDVDAGYMDVPAAFGDDGDGL